MTPVFESFDPQAVEFYETHGYVVLAPQLSPDERAALRRALDALWARYAAEQALSLDAYFENISQWRDLWRHDETFRAALEAPQLWSTAARFMGRAGARLRHRLPLRSSSPAGSALCAIPARRQAFGHRRGVAMEG